MTENQDGLTRRSVLKSVGIGAGTILITAGGTPTLALRTDLSQTAKEIVAEKTERDVDSMQILNESRATYEAIDSRFYDVKVLAGVDGHIHTVMLDGNGNQVDRTAVRNRAAESYRERNGRFGTRLSRLVREADSDDRIKAVVWVNGIDRDAVRNATGVDRTPDSTEDRKVLAAENKSRIGQRTEAVAASLREIPGVSIREVGQLTETVKITATPAALERVDGQDGIQMVMSDEGEWGEALESAAKTQQTWSYRNGKYDASGYTVGIFEMYDYPETNGVNLAGTYDNTPINGDHGHHVALAAAATSSNNPGSAKSADIYSAVEPWTDLHDKITWLQTNDPAVINFSVYHGQDGDRPMNTTDFEYNQLVMNQYLNLTVSAGNDDQVNNGLNVTSPSKGFNQISVGATNDSNDGTKSNDSRASFSCWKNPRSEHDDPNSEDYPHEKPEMCAVGSNLDSDTGYLGAGTSFSSPQLAGIIALVRKFGDDYSSAIDFGYFPEVVKAILMASAYNTGSFEEVGVGNVVAENAESIVSNQQYAHDNFDERDGKMQFTASFDAGDTIQIGLSWLSDVTDADFADNRNARSDIDLNLLLREDDGTPMRFSAGVDKGYEFLEYATAPYTGDYLIDVEQVDWQTTDSSRAFGLSWFGHS